MLAPWPEQHSLGGDPNALCCALGNFSVGLFPQELEISEHVKELQLLDSTDSDPKSFLGLVSLRWGQQSGVKSVDLSVPVVHLPGITQLEVGMLEFRLGSCLTLVSPPIS